MKEFSGVHRGEIITQALSPDGTTVATLSADETISLWKLFEPKKVNLFQGYDNYDGLTDSCV